MTTQDKGDRTDALLQALGAHARSQQAAGTSVSSMDDGDPARGLPDTTRAVLRKVAGAPSAQRAYASALRGLDIPRISPAQAKPTSWFKWLVPSLMFPALAAAGLVLWSGGDIAQLPVYSMEAHGTATMRGNVNAEPFVIRPGTTVQVVLRPASDVGPKIEAKLFWRNGAALVAWPADIEVSPSGAVRASGVVQVPWSNAEAHGELVAFVAPAGTLKTPTVAAISNPPPGVQVIRQAATWLP